MEFMESRESMVSIESMESMAPAHCMDSMDCVDSIGAMDIVTLGIDWSSSTHAQYGRATNAALSTGLLCT